MQPRYITHYFPLFDNTTDKYGNRRDTRSEITEGELTFKRSGIVILGTQGAYGYTRPIDNVRFAGCVANRSVSDQVLVISPPSGDHFRYRYVSREKNWYRLVLVERAPTPLMHYLHALREDFADYGILFGVVLGSIRILWGLAKLVTWYAVLLSIAVFVGMVATEFCEKYYGHHGDTTVLALSHTAWFVEGAVALFFVLTELAYTRGGRRFQIAVPLAAVGFLAFTGIFIFPGLDDINRSARALSTSTVSEVRLSQDLSE